MLDTQELRRLNFVTGLQERPPADAHGESPVDWPTWHIRPVEERDLPRLLRFYERGAGGLPLPSHLYSGAGVAQAEEIRATIHHYRHQPNCMMQVVVEASGIVGLVAVTGSNHLMMRHVAEISLLIADDYRGQGRMLLRAAVEWARGHGGIQRMQTEVLAHQCEAMRLYERFGFVIEGRKRAAYNLSEGRAPGYSDSYLMSLLLPRTPQSAF